MNTPFHRRAAAAQRGKKASFGFSLRLCVSAVLISLTGCASVPRTTIAFDPKTHAISIHSPKDIELTNLKASFNADGSASVTVDSYKARNSVEVISAIAQQNIEMTKAVGAIGAQVIGEAVSKMK